MSKKLLDFKIVVTYRASSLLAMHKRIAVCH